MQSKKLKVLVCFVICAVVFAVSICATETQTIQADDNGAYTVTYTDSSIQKGEYYAILVVQGRPDADGSAPAISEDTILYIDQQTATADGSVSFGSFIPKSNKNATIYIGGSNFDDGAVLFGYLERTGLITVSGTVTASMSPVSITFTDNADSTNTVSYTSTDGTYEVSLAPATYKVEVTAPKHLSYTKTALIVSQDISNNNVVLSGGDIDGSGKVEFADLRAILNNYNLVNEQVDLTGDGRVSFEDLRMVLNNYNAVPAVIS